MAGKLLLLHSNKCWYGRVKLEVGSFDELGSDLFKVPPWIPTACPGNQSQMATGVFIPVCGLDSFAECVLGFGLQFHMGTQLCEIA